MATTKYTYSKITDFVSASYVALGDLFDDISDSSISSAQLEYLNQVGDNVYIYFDNPLSGPDETTLDNIVTDHQGPNPQQPELDDPTLSNDISGTLDNMVVTGIRGVSVKEEVPEHGELLVYSDVLGQYELVHSSSLSVSGSGTSVDWDDHKPLRHLIHFIDSGPAEGFVTGAYMEITGTVFPTDVVWYTDSGKTEKIVERLITWTGVNVTTDKWKMYDSDGSTVLWTISDTISYSGIFETNRTRSITEGDA